MYLEFNEELKKKENNCAVKYIYKLADFYDISEKYCLSKLCPVVDQRHPASLFDSCVNQIQELIRLRNRVDQLDTLSAQQLGEILEYILSVNYKLNDLFPRT